MPDDSHGSRKPGKGRPAADIHIDRNHKQRTRAECEGSVESRLMANATMVVTCSGGTYFDRDHYVDVHLPLALACWQKHGLESAAAFFPRDVNSVDVSVGFYRFRDEASLHAALASADTDAIMDDVPRFTDANVTRMIGAPL